MDAVASSDATAFANNSPALYTSREENGEAALLSLDTTCTTMSCGWNEGLVLRLRGAKLDALRIPVPHGLFGAEFLLRALATA